MTWVPPEYGPDRPYSGGALALAGRWHHRSVKETPLSQPMTSAERRAYNQRKHAEARRAMVADRGPQGIAELWWDQARKIARERAARGDQSAWNDLAMTLTNYCQRYSG